MALDGASKEAMVKRLKQARAKGHMPKGRWRERRCSGGDGTSGRADAVNGCWGWRIAGQPRLGYTM